MGKLLLLKRAPANLAALIDEFGDIKRRQAEFAATGTERRAKQLTEELASLYEDLPADEEFIEKGARYELRVSARRNETVIDNRAVYKKLGLQKFLKACTLTLKALKEFLPAPDISEVATETRTGWRSFVPTPLGRPDYRDSEAA